MLDRILGFASVVSFGIGALSTPAGPPSTVEFSFRDPEIIESSALVALPGGLFATVNDSGDSGRVFVVDGSGRTVGTTTWAEEVTDVESLAPAGRGSVWVGDTGDNLGRRDAIEVLKAPVGRFTREVTPASYTLVYPDGAHDAETLLADPESGRLLVVTKSLLGGTLYEAPERLSTEEPNRLHEVAESMLPIATDGSFFPDGRHYVVRGYGNASVYTFPGNVRVGSFPLPDQQQGEGITVTSDGALDLSSEGRFSEVLRVEVPPPVRQAMEPTAAPPARPVEVRPAGSSTSDAPWWVVGGVVGAGFVLLAGWLLRRRGAAP